MLIILCAVAINFDVTYYAEKVKVSVQNGTSESASDESLKKYFKKTSIGCIQDAAILVDESGRIIAWYLPGILNHQLVRPGYIFTPIPTQYSLSKSRIILQRQQFC